MFTPLLLGVLAVLLAGPLPALMARRPSLRRTPRSAMVLWQSVALAAILSAVGAGVSLVTASAWQREVGVGEYVVATVAASITLLVVARLLWTGHRIGTRLRELRRAHRDQVDLLAQLTPTGVSLLSHELPVAWCVPSMSGSRIVVSTGAVAALTEPEVDAVLDHERAHLKARHDLVIEAFTVLHDAFPRWVSSRLALGEVALLVEVLADRAALRRASPAVLAGALLAVAGGLAPDGTLGAGGSSILVTRVELLADRAPRPAQAALLVVASLAVLVLPTAFIVVPWLTQLP